jgi:hypothetical protein
MVKKAAKPVGRLEPSAMLVQGDFLLQQVPEEAGRDGRDTLWLTLDIETLGQ